MMDMREAVEEASDSQALKQIESQVEQCLFGYLHLLYFISPFKAKYFLTLII